MRILIRTSKWAIWARRFGSLALPLAILPVPMHRAIIVTGEQFVVIEALAGGVAALAVFLAIGAFVRLWITGDQGWARALLGLFFGLICLAPLAYFGYEAVRYPDVTGISTDFDDPPPLVADAHLPSLDAPLRARVATAFPDARSRSYALDPTQIFDVVADLVDDRNWDVRVSRAPASATDTGQLNAVAMTPLGWRGEVSVRVAPSVQGSIVDVASASFDTFHDLGANGKRVEEFLNALDARVTQLLRQAVPAPATDADTPDDTPDKSGGG